MRYSINLQRRRRRRRRGTAATELAVLLVPLCVVVGGAIDFGRFAYTYIAVQNSARAGAALGCVSPYNPTTDSTQFYQRWQATCQQAAIDEWSQSSGNGLDYTKVQATATWSQNPFAVPEITVTVTYHPFTTIIRWPMVPNSFDIQATCVLRMIRV
jgi:Flp pilus assembly protein TadG